MSNWLVEPSFTRILVWEIFCVAACFGWGWPVQSLLSGESKTAGNRVGKKWQKYFSFELSFGSAGTFGLAFLLVAAGIANLAGWMGTKTIVVTVGLGSILCFARMFFFCARGFQKIRSMNGYFAVSKGTVTRSILIVALCMMSWAQFSFRARSLAYNPVDDYQAYLVFPAKMLAAGNLGYEPFSERRLLSTLGGKYALDAVVLWGNGFKSLSGADHAIGLIILLGALWGMGKVMSLPFWVRAFLWFWALILGTPSTNLTPITLALPLILLLATEVRRKNAPWQWRNHLTAILLASGLILLKNSLIPLSGLLLLGVTVPTLQLRWSALSQFVKSVGVSVIGILILCSPWMISSYQDCFTLWFPFLGKGSSALAYGGSFQYITYDAFGPRVVGAVYSLLSEPKFLALALTIPGLFLVWWINPKFNLREFSLPLSATLATIMILAQQASPQGDRFAFAGVVAGTIYGFAVLTKSGTEGIYKFWFSNLNSAGERLSKLFAFYFFKKVSSVNIVILILSLSIFSLSIADTMGSGRLSLCYAIIRDPIRCIRNIARVAEAELCTSNDILRYRTAQAHIPKGSVVLDRTLMPFLWDFNQHAIYIADIPGAASPPPGIPIGKGPSALRAFLESQGVGYVAYDYAAEGGLYSKIFGYTEFDPKVHPWQRSQFRYARLVQQDIEALSQVCRTIFKDDKMEIFAIGLPP